MGRAECWSPCPEGTEVCSTDFCTASIPPCTQERAVVHGAESAQGAFVTDFKVQKFWRRNCYSPHTQVLEENLTLGASPTIALAGRGGTPPPLLSDSLHAGNIFCHSTSATCWNILDTATNSLQCFPLMDYPSAPFQLCSTSGHTASPRQTLLSPVFYMLLLKGHQSWWRSRGPTDR